ncbi:RagB/SusD family nutrient uptake outer membrane protein [uncultured Phocaeicola sp.]|jgi:hypothetical protein|uniref:RagB/SusD family nutrient uptake outer membrane protein n=1 Tax=uncultured Phocaeicola sp. TaxID=990718 RepID=UPI00258DF2D0|nr:RagB/SusD family nutrient uptake outer membrane protein [uncultured Phocaeicola sp.]
MKTYNKLIKNIFFCTVLGATVCSCDLDVEPTSNIATETFWKTEKDAWYNLNAIYAKSIPSSNVHGESYTEDVYCQYSWESSGPTFLQDGFSPLYDSGWNFETIRKQNNFLVEVENCVMDEDLKKRFIAEVRAMRAWTYLGMTITFGKVPLITEVLPYDAPNVPRDEASVVRKFILDELTEAAAVLPAKYKGGYPNEKGRMTKYAALAVKARAALYFGEYAVAEQAAKEVMDNGGYSLFRISELSDAQKKEAEEMSLYIDFDKYGIDRDKFVKGMFSYEALWHTENANPDNPEYIMTHQYVANSDQDWVRYTAIRPNQLGGWSSVTPTQNFVDSYWTVDGKEADVPSVEERAAAYAKLKADADAYSLTSEDKDKNMSQFVAFTSNLIKSGELKNYEYMKEFRNRDSRLYVSVLFPCKSWYESDYGTNYVYEWGKGGNNESKTGFNFRKMSPLENDPIDDGFGEATGDYPCIRYAEILLIYAEAHTQTTGFDSQTQAALNQLRDRCGMPNVPTSLSKEAGLELIANERRIELVGEGFRSDDMYRYSDEYWNKHINNVDITSPDGDKIITMKWNSRMHLRPIPQTAIDLNPLLANDQNPGY